MREDNSKQLINRAKELSMRADNHGIFTHTEFLSMAEQSDILSQKLPLQPSFFGGYEAAERRIACFNCDEVSNVPITCLRISPVSKKFAEDLSHRDILGAVMSLGIERKVTGDIIKDGSDAYIFCLENIAEYIIDNLTSVKHTKVYLSIGSIPDKLLSEGTEKNIFVASLRIDALISSVYGLGRTAAKDLVQAEKVFVDSRLLGSAGIQVKEGSIVSVRGFGRFIYKGTEKTTKKGNLCVKIEVF